MMEKRSGLMFFCAGLLLAVTLACGQSAPAGTPEVSQSPGTLAQGDSTRSLSFGGQERSYIVHIPANYNPNNPTPMVLIFHGFGLNAEDMIRITGFNDQADADGFIAVYPLGSGNKPA
jgi:polyhydroxybutyrate depolymerase